MSTPTLYAPIDLERLPKHVGIIMDGNGRWAKQNKLKVAMGHRAGTEALREIIRNSSDIGIQALSLYAFSTENWNRSQAEVEALMQLILDFFHSEIDELDEKNVRITILGDKAALPEKQREALIQAEERTGKNTGLKLNIAINYGGRAELVRAAQLLAQDVKAGVLSPEAFTEELFADRPMRMLGYSAWISLSIFAAKSASVFLMADCQTKRISFSPPMYVACLISSSEISLPSI